MVGGRGTIDRRAQDKRSASGEGGLADRSADQPDFTRAARRVFVGARGASLASAELSTSEAQIFRSSAGVRASPSTR